MRPTPGAGAAGEWTLAIDLGTTFTTAVSRGRPEPVETAGLHSGVFRMPSLVWLDGDGALIAGSRAESRSASDLDGVERNLKQLLGKGQRDVPGSRFTVEDGVAALLGAALREACRSQQGSKSARVVLTHPSHWDGRSRAALREAALRAGIARVDLLPAPLAAAAHLGEETVGAGEYVAVYDLGGGTLDAAVLQRTNDGSFELVAAGGRDGLGGELFDRRLAEHLKGALRARSAADATALERSPRALASLLRRALGAKEALSGAAAYDVVLPEVTALASIRVTRSDFEGVVREDIRESVDLLSGAIEDAGLRPADLSAIFMLGGSSRIPLVAAELTQRFARTPDTRDDPKDVVALGALRPSGTGVPSPTSKRAPTRPTPRGDRPAARPHPPEAPPGSARTHQSGPAGRSRRPSSLTVLVSVLALLVGAGGFLLGRVAGPASSSAEPANPSEAAQTLSGGYFRIVLPVGWKQSDVQPRIRGLRLGDALVAAPDSAKGSGIAIGQTRATGRFLLAQDFVDRLRRRPSLEDTVKLGRIQAHRYRGLRASGFRKRLTLYAAPTTSGVATVACFSPRDGPRSFMAACESVATSLELVGARARPLGPDRRYARRLTRLFDTLNLARAGARRDLRRASTRAAQAEAAQRAARAYISALQRAQRTRPPLQAAPAHRSIISALVRSGRAYLEMAAAAQSGDPRSWEATGRAARRAESALQRALVGLEKLDYRVG